MAKEQWRTVLRNNRAWKYYFYRLYSLAISTFEWVNLPPTVDPRFIEKTLFYNGFALYFSDDVLGQLCLGGTIGGKFNVYDIPTDRRAVASNGYQKNLTEADSVIVWNNLIHESDIFNISYLCDKLWEIDRTIDVNVKGQKTPWLITGTETQRLTLLNLVKKIDENECFIFGDKNLDTQALNVLKLEAPYTADKLMILKKQIWCEALTYLGINNSPDSKKERELVDEVNSNLEEIKASRDNRLNARLLACDEINRMFGLTGEKAITVEFRDTIDTISSIGNDGGGADGGLHDID